MLKEFVDSIRGLTDDARKPQLQPIPGDDRYLLIDGEKHELPPQRREHTVECLDTFIDAVKHYGTKASVWHDDGAIVCLIEDEDRRDTVRLPLAYSDQWAELTAIAGKPLAQKQLVLFLKQKMRGAIDDTLLAAVRRIEFKRRSDGSGNIQHGKESLGKSIEAEVQGIDAIPEMAVANVAVYSTPGCEIKSGVGLSLDIDVEAQQFSLTPFADEIPTAINVVQAAIHDLLVESLGDTPVFHGTP